MDTLESAASSVQEADVQPITRRQKLRKWLIIFATVILAIFIIYMLLILVYPSLAIGTNP